ncbi:hypothetical protein ACHAXS_012666 [Conticribra weissflogii]
MGTTPSTTPAKRSPPQCRKPKTSKSRKTKTDASIFSPVAVPSHSAAMACHVKIPTQLPLLIVDNGGWTVKYGILRLPPRPPISSSASTEPEEVTAKNIPPNEKNEGILISPRENDKIIQNITMASMYNATAQPPQQLTILTGDEITTRMKNLGQLSWNHSMERGIICDGGTQLRVWNRVLEVSNVAVPIPGLGLRNLPASRGRRGIEQQHIQMQMPLGGVPAVASSSGGTPLLNQTKISSGNCAFLLLEPPFVPSVISDGVDKILFRELGLGRVARLLGPCMAAVKYISSHNSILEQGDQNDPAQMTHDTINKRGRYEIVPDNVSSSLQKSIHMNGDEKENRLDEVWINDGTKCCCVVDSGYSFTHVVPTHRGGAIESSIRRLNIGGKVLTNLLKEAVTYRQWNMMDEYHIVNDCKEQLCFVSNQFETEMKQARKIRKGFREFDREFLLPDFVNTFHGTVRLPEPLQWKKDAEEEKQIRMEIEAQQKKSGGEGQIRTNKTVENIDKNDDTYRKGNENSKESKITTKSKQSKSNKNEFLKLPRKRPKRGKIADANTVNNEAGDCDNETTEDSESDDESDEQRLHRLKQMREEERKRREQESLERQAIAMSVERFAIPEVLFRPSDIGMDCGGIVEAIVESIDACDAVYRAAMYNNVLLVGGNAKIPGFRDRVELELRKLAPVHYPVRVYLPDDPVSYSWEGAKQFAMQPDFQEKFTVDRISWEAMKTAGKDQKEIWGGRSCSRLRHVSMRS